MFVPGDARASSPRPGGCRRAPAIGCRARTRRASLGLRTSITSDEPSTPTTTKPPATHRAVLNTRAANDGTTRAAAMQANRSCTWGVHAISSVRRQHPRNARVARLAQGVCDRAGQGREPGSAAARVPHRDLARRAPQPQHHPAPSARWPQATQGTPVLISTDESREGHAAVKQVAATTALVSSRRDPSRRFRVTSSAEQDHNGANTRRGLVSSPTTIKARRTPRRRDRPRDRRSPLARRRRR